MGASDDGLLGIDRNENGTLDNINELFGNAATDGFVELSDLDTNLDGVIDNLDSQFTDLVVWVDGDQDGLSELDEIKTLGEYGIISIELSAQTVNVEQSGNLVSTVSSFTRSDLSTSTIADVWFANDQTNTHLVSDAVSFENLDLRILSLPKLNGYGEIAAIRVAMLFDSELVEMATDLAISDLSTAATFSDQVEAILYRWAGVETVDPSSRGYYIDARHLEFMEAFFGEDWVHRNGGSNPHPRAAYRLETTWEGLQAELEARLLVQGPLSQVFPDVEYDYLTDNFTGSRMTARKPTRAASDALLW